tara:strand:+ start:244 stop:393 length:150 start_codon:yes stop_codon:yes gene_type:complete
MKVEVDAKDYDEMKCKDCGISSFDTSGFIVIDKYTCEECKVYDDGTGEL